MKKWTPVLLEWLDAHGGDEGWTPPNRKWHKGEPVRTVGLLYRQDAEGITLVMSRCKGGSVGGYIFVPAVNVVSIRELK